jgi:hypothetical protein
MEHTREDIRHTVGELRERVSETLDWRHYVNRYPGTSLTIAMALGLVVGRGVAAMVGRREDIGDRLRHGYSGSPTESYGEAALTPTPGRAMGEESMASGPRRAVSETWSRLGSRVENIVNRVVDEVTDAVEATLIPALSGWVRGRLDFGAASGGGRRDWAPRPDRPGRGGVYGGGPSGPQHYPMQGHAQGHAAEQG